MIPSSSSWKRNSLPFPLQLPGIGLDPLKGFLSDSAAFIGPCRLPPGMQGLREVCLARGWDPRTQTRTTATNLDCVLCCKKFCTVFSFP